MKPFSVFFWAVMMILAGLVLLIRHLGKFQFSSWSVIFGLFVILLGISLLIGGVGNNKVIETKDSVVFSSGVITPNEDGECNIIFSSGTVDLRQMEQDKKIEVNVIFSSADVLLPEGPVQVKATAAFGQVVLPEGGSVVFGDRTYATSGDDPLVVEINCVFGSASVR